LSKNVGKSTSNKYLPIMAPITAALTIIALAPYILMDSVNPIKLLIVSTFGFGYILIFVINFRQIKNEKSNLILWASSSFIILSVFVTFTTQNELSQQLYGVIGRQTGLILHLGLFGLLIAGNLFASQNLLVSSMRIFQISGVIIGSYGLIQIFDFDPLTWSSNSGWVAATLANPNFFSSFIGMLVCVTLPYIISAEKVSSKVLYLLSVLICVFIIIKTSSQQGIILVLLGVAITLYFYIKSKNLPKGWLWSYVSLSTLGFMVLLLDIFQKVPWEPILYKTSVSARGDYWRAGLAVIEKHPLTGVGFDGLREQFGLVREPISLTRGDQLDLDAAHNVYIDKGIAGGVPLLILYLIIIIIVAIAIKKLASNMSSFKPELVAVISCWITWAVQGVISIDNVGLASWGWYLSGLITGLAAMSGKSTQEYFEPRVKIKFGLKPYITGALIGAIIATPLITREYRYVKSIESGDAKALQAAALQFPQDIFRIGRAAEILKEYKIQKESLFLAQSGVKNFPESYAAWAVLYTSPWASETERAQAKVKLFELDPYRAKFQGFVE
jgi:O-antigen ligase